MTARAAVYLRISDPKGDTAERFGLATQERACREYAERTGLVVQKVYSDAITGTTEQRVGFGKLLADAGAYSDVVVYAVDRLARHPRAGYALLETLQAAGLQVHTAIEGMLDLQDDAGALNFGVRIVMADAERRRMVRRLSEGKRQKVRGGQPIRALNGFGFKDSQIDEAQAQWVRWIYQAAMEMGTHEIRMGLYRMGVASPMGKEYWDRDAIMKLLKNSTYRGEYVYGNDRSGRRPLPDAVRCRVPQIVPDELWYAVQRAIQLRSRGAGKRGSRTDLWALTGRIRCAECGGAMVGMGAEKKKTGGAAYYYYRCGDQHLSPHTRKHCAHRRNYRAADIHRAVREGLAALLTDNAALAGALVQPPPVKLDTSAAVRDLDGQLSKARNAYLRGIDTEDEYAASKALLTAQRSRLLTLAEQGEAHPVADIAAARRHLEATLQEPALHLTAARLGLKVHVAPGGELRLVLDPA